MMAMAFAVGQTAIIVPVGAAEPIVGRWRTQFDPAATAGVPAHVTIIYPFLSRQDIDDNVVREVRRLVAHHPSFTVTFADGGLITDPVPHLTITHGASPKDAAQAEVDVRARLPLTCPIPQAWLIGFDGMRW